MSTLSLVKIVINKPWLRVFSTTNIKLDTENNKQRPLEVREITKDRSKEIPVEVSIKYLKSRAYQETYEGKPVWELYRRNHKGSIPPRKTRKTCIRAGAISTGNPCPICRDEYLVLNEQNIDLLKQFICPHTGSILSYTKTGLCQKKHQKLLISIRRAFDTGELVFDVPHRQYDYKEYYSQRN